MDQCKVQQGICLVYKMQSQITSITYKNHMVLVVQFCAEIQSTYHMEFVINIRKTIIKYGILLNEKRNFAKILYLNLLTNGSFCKQALKKQPLQDKIHLIKRQIKCNIQKMSKMHGDYYLLLLLNIISPLLLLLLQFSFFIIITIIILMNILPGYTLHE